MLTIYHTNDLHNSLTEGRAALLRGLKEQSPDTLLLDAGDAIWAGNVFVRPGGEPALKLMSDAGYDAMTVGNREFHFLQSGLRHKIGWARFPVICANIRPTKAGTSVPVVAYISREIAEMRVAIMGLTVRMITERMLARRISDYVFDDPVKVAVGLAQELRHTHDLVIALTHIGLKEDRRLADEVPGIDLIIGGHTHALLESPELVNGTAIVQAGSRGRQVGWVEVEKHGTKASVRGGVKELRDQ